MLACKWHAAQTIAAGLGLCSALIVHAGPASAEPPAPAPDGQVFQNQSRSTQDTFTATFGQSCAPVEWLWQHALALATDFVGGPAASDGQTLTGQDDDIQLMFVALFGTQANAEWLAEHNAVVAHRVLPNPVAPIQCLAARNRRPPEAVGTVHLAAAVEAARAGDLDAAYGDFAAFKTIWNTTRAGVATRSATLAQRVQMAFDVVNALIGDPKAPTPQQSQYYPALQNLQQVVQDLNATLDH